AICLKQLKQDGKTVVIVTHKANILGGTDRTLILKDGIVQRYVATAELLQSQQKSYNVTQFALG
ncbi:MAG: hypothetical protein IT466_09950, partial [Moraxellaceae bacterium]|nr:hypothetical protein [Moraxellaceae bacterium]